MQANISNLYAKLTKLLASSNVILVQHEGKKVDFPKCQTILLTEANMILSENAVSLVKFSNVHIPTR